jgi:hypothetical protein
MEVESLRFIYNSVVGNVAVVPKQVKLLWLLSAYKFNKSVSSSPCWQLKLRCQIHFSRPVFAFPRFERVNAAYLLQYLVLFSLTCWGEI